MKSQVNSLLLVMQGLCKDVQASYPALKDGLSKDMDRLRLYCQTRALALFTLDLPSLESCLLHGLESGRLDLEGPLSRKVSKDTKVPRLFSGLWLRVFDKSACLRQEVDVNALMFLRQLLVIGKRIETDCTYDRLIAKVGEYHDIERSLRKPSFTWECDYFRPRECDDSPNGGLSTGDLCLNGSDHGDHYLPLGIVSEETTELKDADHHSYRGDDLSSDLQRVHLVQAVDYVHPSISSQPCLFRMEMSRSDQERKVEDIRLLNQIQQVADLIFSSFDKFDADQYSDQMFESGRGSGFKHGPGAVAERLKNWEKSQFPNWPHKLEGRFPFRVCGTTAGSGRPQPQNHEVASRLIAVPKTAKGPRLIAAEPTSHQWCQQLLLSFLFNQCRATFGTHFIDFKDQQKSGDMVLRASLDRELATVDLSDASDRLTCWTVERIVRRNPSLLTALHAARTRYIRDEISNDVSFLSLRKFASQGTATTFPIMSLVMLCIALGVSLDSRHGVTWGSIRELRGKVRVFGDDIIIPRYGYERLVRAMDLLQLKVNLAKSYVNGHFRESCGTDGFRGYDITPVKPRTLVADSPASCQAVVDTSNNLFNKGYWNASSTVESLLPISVRKYLRIVGRNEAGFRGLTSFVGGDESHLRKRWNPRLHRREVRVWSIQSQTKERPRNDFEGLLDFFTRSHSSVNPRIVSQYLEVRNTRTRVLWEPQNTDARAYD